MGARGSVSITRGGKAKKKHRFGPLEGVERGRVVARHRRVRGERGRRSSHDDVATLLRSRQVRKHYKKREKRMETIRFHARRGRKAPPER